MRCSSRLRSETGSSLMITIMLLMVVSGLIAAIIASSMTDTLVARNHQSGAQAQAAAEAGLNHAIDAARIYLRDWESNFTNTNDAVSRLLRGPDDVAGTTATDADNGSLVWIPNGTPTPPATLNLAALNGVALRGAHLRRRRPRAPERLDGDRPGQGEGPGGLPQWRPESGRPGRRPERHLRCPGDGLRAGQHRGHGGSGDEAAALAGDRDERRPESRRVSPILGDGGSIHSNGNITEVGVAAVVQGDVTAVSNITANNNWHPVTGLIESGQLPIPIPPVNVSDYVEFARYRLGSDGSIYRRATAADAWVAVCTTNLTCKNMGFPWSSAAGSISSIPGIVRNWDTNNPFNAASCTTLAANGIPDCGYGVYWAELGDVTISGNLGNSTNPYRMSLLVDGSVRITGTPQLEAFLQNPRVMIVTNGDLKMLGTANCVIYGQMRVREQFELAGRMTLQGQILVENRTNLSTLVDANRVYGNATVTNDRLAVYDFAVAGWREFRR